MDFQIFFFVKLTTVLEKKIENWIFENFILKNAVTYQNLSFDFFLIYIFSEFNVKKKLKIHKYFHRYGFLKV